MALDFKNTGTTQNSLALLCVVCAVLQLVVAPQLSLFGGRINFMLALVMAAALGGDSGKMVYVGFFAGLFYDLTSSAPIGFMALLLTLVAYALALLSRGVMPGFSLDAVRLVVVASFVANVIYALGLFFMGVEGNILIALGSHGLTSAVLTCIATIPLLLVSGGGASRSRGFSSPRRGTGTRFKGL